MNDVTIIIFGATGDLCKRKIIPALYRLIRAGKLTNYTLVGAARENSSVQDILKNAKPFIDNCDEATWQNLVQHFFYQPVDVTQYDDVKKLAIKVEELEKHSNASGNRIIYCAVASSFFCAITDASAKSGLARKTEKNKGPWHRIVYEKPFGSDLASAQAINKCIAEHFNEHQIYRIDHYLLKEFVSNIALVRFTNCVLEPLWNNRYIDSVQIVLNESIGIGDRGSYYNAYGAVADIMQNHLLEIMALIAMESPEKLTGEYIRSERAKVLSKVKAIDVLFGQYESYHDEPHIPAKSQTETFAVALLRIENPRWAGVPFYLKTGKYLSKKETVIHIKFKKVECLLARNCPSESNYLTISISPESILALSLNVKKPGLTNDVVPVQMEFSHTKLMGAVTPEAYEILFEEIMRGEESVSVRFDEIESAWHIVDQLRALKPELYSYAQGSMGPTQVNSWAFKHGMRWLS